MIAGHAIHFTGGGRNTAKDVAAPQYHAHLYAGLRHFRYLSSQGLNPVMIEAERKAAGQRFTTDLQKNALISGHGCKSGAY
jgi:hypothetical protein